MKRKIILLVLVVILLYPTLSYSEDTEVELVVLETVQKHDVAVIVTLENRISDDLGIHSGANLKHFRGNTYTARVSQEELQALIDDPNVLSIEEDEIFTLDLSDSVPLVNASLVHSKQFSGTNLTGADQTVCVIDSGVNSTHTSLEGRIVAQHCFCDVTDYGSGGCCSADVSENFTVATDDVGHGTHVTGIVAANGTDILGVAPAASIVAVKVTNSSSNGPALFSDIIEAVDFCVNNATLYNISVITMSLGGGSFSAHCDSSYSTLSNSINNAWDANISVTVSSGNDGSTTAISSPACINRSIAVSSITKTYGISSFSNRNGITDIMAPGTSITSTKLAGGTEVRSGTSMSAPHVAGAILLLQQYKEDVESRSLTAEEVNNTVTTNGTSIDDSGGSGSVFTLLDVLESLSAIDNLEPAIDEPNTSNANNYIYNNVTFVANSTDVNLESVWVEVNFSGAYVNYTMAQVEGAKYNFSVGNDTTSTGTFQWRIHSNDSHGNENVTNFFDLTILTGAPIITIHGPPDKNFTNNNTAVFNFTATDDVNINLSCDLYLDGVLNQTNSTTLNGTVTQFNNTLSDGSYSWFISCSDNESLGSNSTARTLTIDTVFPVLLTESFHDPIELGDTQSYSTNISETNVLYVNFSHLGENTSMTNSSANYSTSFITVQNGSNSYVVYASDEASNLNTTSGTFVVQDSLSGPRVINIGLTSSLAQGATQVITAYIVNGDPIHSAVIDINGTNSTMTNNTFYNFTHSFTTDTCGSTPVKIFANDSTGLAVVNTTSFTVTGCEAADSDSGGGGGGGGSGGGGGGADGGGGGGEESNKIVLIVPSANSDLPIDFDISNSNIAVTEVYIEVNKELSNLKVGVEALSGKPGGLPDPSLEIYQYLEIYLENFGNDDISSSEVTFSIPGSWVTDNNIDSERIVLLRYTDSWDELTTSVLSSGDNYVGQAKVPGYSYFAIAGETLEIIIEEGDEIAELHEEVVEEAPQGSPGFIINLKKQLWWITILVVIVVVLVIVLILRRRNKPKSEGLKSK